jgi:hypothetical protein
MDASSPTFSFYFVKTKHNMPKLAQLKAITIAELLEKVIPVDLLKAVIPQ